jgi:hypothetical protein
MSGCQPCDSHVLLLMVCLLSVSVCKVYNVMAAAVQVMVTLPLPYTHTHTHTHTHTDAHTHTDRHTHTHTHWMLEAVFLRNVRNVNEVGSCSGVPSSERQPIRQPSVTRPEQCLFRHQKSCTNFFFWRTWILTDFHSILISVFIYHLDAYQQR